MSSDGQPKRRLGGYGMPVEPNTHRLIRNECWPRFAENFAEREPISVLAHVLFARGWPPVWLPAHADRWNDTFVRVVLDPPVHGPRRRLASCPRRSPGEASRPLTATAMPPTRLPCPHDQGILERSRERAR